MGNTDSTIDNKFVVVKTFFSNNGYSIDRPDLTDKAISLLADLVQNSTMNADMDKLDDITITCVALYYQISGQNDMAKIYFMFAIAKKYYVAMRHYGSYCLALNDLDEAEKYLLDCYTNTNSIAASYLLTCLYEKKGDIDKMILYHKKAVADDRSKVALGDYYKNINDHEQMIKYYELAGRMKNKHAINELINYYANNRMQPELVYWLEKNISYGYKW